MALYLFYQRTWSNIGKCIQIFITWSLNVVTNFCHKLSIDPSLLSWIENNSNHVTALLVRHDMQKWVEKLMAPWSLYTTLKGLSIHHLEESAVWGYEAHISSCQINWIIANCHVNYGFSPSDIVRNLGLLRKIQSLDYPYSLGAGEAKSKLVCNSVPIVT